MKPLLTILLALLFSGIAKADLEVKVKQATANISSYETKTVQVTTEDGIKIGNPKITILPPVEKKGKSIVILLIKTSRPIDELLIKPKSDTCDPYLVEPGVYAITTPGTHKVEVNAIGQNPLSWDDETVTFTVGSDIDPDPPGPDPGPEPGPAPIEGEGLRVLFIHETSKLLDQKYTKSFYGPKITNFLNENCIKVNGQPDFRRLDPDAKFTDPNHRFAKALKRPRTADPWLIISDGTKGYEGPFPDSEQETMDLLQQFASFASSDSVKVTMVSMEGCPPCRKFEIEEASDLGSILTITKKKPKDVVITSYPTFIIEVGNRRRISSSYLTASQIKSIIRDMKKEKI